MLINWTEIPICAFVGPPKANPKACKAGVKDQVQGEITASSADFLKEIWMHNVCRVDDCHCIMLISSC